MVSKETLEVVLGLAGVVAYAKLQRECYKLTINYLDEMMKVTNSTEKAIDTLFTDEHCVPLITLGHTGVYFAIRKFRSGNYSVFRPEPDHGNML